ncbi:MAG: hypothetical protein LBR95_08545 [Azoarcus sp.]|nr:hypothetical protein [Azoarcus sp.]
MSARLSAGKTTLGKQAADVLGIDFVDTDMSTTKTLMADDFPLAKIFSAVGQGSRRRASPLDKRGSKSAVQSASAIRRHLKTS